MVNELGLQEAPTIVRGKRGTFAEIWLLPYALAAFAYLLGTYVQAANALRESVLPWPVLDDVYDWLLLILVLACGWLVVEFITVTDRESERWGGRPSTASMRQDCGVESPMQKRRPWKKLA